MRKYPVSLLRWSLVVAAAFGAATLAFAVTRAADPIPTQYTDAEFWRLVNDLSEPGGAYPYENFVSNEISYQMVIPEMKRLTKPGGVYLGVAPEQNFTYIAAVQPKVAFVLDIRRQNMILLLTYKALFEMAPNRADFVSRLFSRRRPAGLDEKTSVEALFKAFDGAPADAQLYAETLAAIRERLRQRQFKPVGDDDQKIEFVFNVFYRGGPRMSYAFASPSPNQGMPAYYFLMMAGDENGHNWAYLASEEAYRFVREMQQKNLIVPLVGDFAGPKTLKAVGQYLRDRGEKVSVFYLSNVEDYIEPNWAGYLANLKALPQDDATLVIRHITPKTQLLGWMKDVPERWPGMYTNPNLGLQLK